MAAGILQIQRMCVSLAAVADDGNGLALQQRQITILLIKNFSHFLFLRFGFQYMIVFNFVF